MRGRWADNAYWHRDEPEPELPTAADQYELQQATNAHTRFAQFCDDLADIVNDRKAEWRRHAACRGLGPELFFAEWGDMSTAHQAAAVCAECPVIQQCDEYGTSRHQRFGVWGGKAGRNRNRGTWDRGAA